MGEGRWEDAKVFREGSEKPQRYIWFPLHHDTGNCAAAENHPSVVVPGECVLRDPAELGQDFAEDINLSQVASQGLFCLCGYYGCGDMRTQCALSQGFYYGKNW